MKQIVSNVITAACFLLLVVLAVGLGIESAWAWVNHIGPAAWWVAPVGLLESFGLLVLVGWCSVAWMRELINKR